jgi:hypothetical protein
MNKSLYNIKEEAIQLYHKLDEAGGELSEELEQALIINENELQTKSVSYVGLIKSIESETLAAKEEVQRINNIVKRNNNIVERLKGNIKDAMLTYNIDEIKTPIITIKFRSSKSIVVDDIEALPMTLKTVKVTTAADKKAIKALIDSGEEVKGARLVTNQNIQIK